MRDFTFNCGTWARLEIKDSVRPSLRKSVSALLPELANGITAIDSIWDELNLTRQYQIPAAAIVMNKRATATNQDLRAEVPAVPVGGAAADFPDSLSRFSRCKSVRISAACW